jgi:hypothetical protein
MKKTDGGTPPPLDDGDVRVHTQFEKIHGVRAHILARDFDTPVANLVKNINQIKLSNKRNLSLLSNRKKKTKSSLLFLLS